MKELRAITAEILSLKADVQAIKEGLSVLVARQESIDDLGRGVGQIEQLLSRAFRSRERPLHAVHTLNLFFDKSDSPRKPYLLKADGIITATQKLSPIRAAILLTLLLDLQDRYENGRGVMEPLRAISKALAILSGNSGRDDARMETLRVALYRFDIFFQDQKSFGNDDYRLWFDAKNIRLVLFDQRAGKAVDSASVQVTTNDPAIAAVLNQILAESPINRARKRKALYVPAGPEGADRFLLEMYDHNFPLKVTSLYIRPPFPSYPTSLLEYIGVSERVIERKRLAFEGYKVGRFNFVEILPEATIWDLIRYSPRQGFKLYPKSVRASHVLEHLDNLIYILNNYENYNVYLTGASIPFVLVTYEIRSGVMPEYFTVFFQAFSSASERDLGCFVLHDPLAYQSITENIVDWIVSHPTTVRDRGEVIRTLRQVRDHLDHKGPLPLLK